jgi:predicted protein tyrosine phosphatase
MHPFLQRLFVCGFEERAEHRARQITHLVSVTNPGVTLSKPPWFNGPHLELWFGDVVSEADAKNCRTTAPTSEDVLRAIEFFRNAWRMPDTKVLVSCGYGASRSPALAYIFIADVLGSGREAEAFRLMLEIRPNAVPNGLVVRLGDTLLKRQGALLQPLRDLHAKLNAELFGSAD